MRKNDWREEVNKLVFYAQSTGVDMSGRWREEGKVRNERIQREGEKEIIKGRREGRMN